VIQSMRTEVLLVRVAVRLGLRLTVGVQYTDPPIGVFDSGDRFLSSVCVASLGTDFDIL